MEFDFDDDDDDAMLAATEAAEAAEAARLGHAAAHVTPPPGPSALRCGDRATAARLVGHLCELCDAGILTKAEFADKKALLIPALLEPRPRENAGGKRTREADGDAYGAARASARPSGIIRIYVLDNNGYDATFRFALTAQLEDLRSAFAAGKGVAEPRTLRLYIDGSELDYRRTPAYYEMEDGEWIDCSPEKCGDIGTFGAHDGTPGRALLEHGAAVAEDAAPSVGSDGVPVTAGSDAPAPHASGTIRIYILFYNTDDGHTGDEVMFRVVSTAQLEDVLSEYAASFSASSGVPRNVLRFLFDGSRIQGSDTPAYHEMADGARIHCLREMRGDIGTFGAHDGTPGRALLRHGAAVGEDAVARLCAHFAAAPGRSRRAEPFFASFPAARLLDNGDRTALMRDVDAAHARGAQGGASNGACDFKLPLSCEDLAARLGAAKFGAIVDFFAAHLPSSPVFTDVVVRRTTPCGCINFHVDESLATMSVPLNDDFVGGSLVFLDEQNGRLVTPARPPASATLHNHGVPHGVTTLEAFFFATASSSSRRRNSSAKKARLCASVPSSPCAWRRTSGASLANRLRRIRRRASRRGLAEPWSPPSRA
ncbi:hypothetical protein M885DRAFT_507292 [Pelagophyceae sp. CCMP2097]|nr:hypothetical protein M885DRAFT_507292 [Pelagophyceae sp. CCMP2097]